MPLLRPALAFALALLAALPSPARAAESYDSCKYEITSLPAVLSSQGTWCLKTDLSSSLDSGAAIVIGANNVTLDCNHFKVGGLSAGTATQAIGIGAQSRSNLAVRHCNVRGFRIGLYTSAVASPTVEDNVFEYSTFAGIYMTGGDNTTVRRNRVMNIGESTAPDVPGAVGIYVEYLADIVDNVVSGVRAPGPGDQYAIGIHTVNASSTVIGNRVRLLAPSGAGIATGIRNEWSWRSATVGNIVDLNGQAGGVGIFCDAGNGMARDNTLLGTAQPVFGCQEMGNFADPN
jgi:parallel beta-helix repeat protein